MKAVRTIIKILAALAAVAGAIYVIATYGDKIVAWAKKVLNRGCCCCDEDGCCDEDCCCDEDGCCDESCCCEESCASDDTCCCETSCCDAPATEQSAEAEDADFEA